MAGLKDCLRRLWQRSDKDVCRCSAFWRHETALTRACVPSQIYVGQTVNGIGAVLVDIETDHALRCFIGRRPFVLLGRHVALSPSTPHWKGHSRTCRIGVRSVEERVFLVGSEHALAVDYVRAVHGSAGLEALPLADARECLAEFTQWALSDSFGETLGMSVFVLCDPGASTGYAHQAGKAVRFLGASAELDPSGGGRGAASMCPRVRMFRLWDEGELQSQQLMLLDEAMFAPSARFAYQADYALIEPLAAEPSSTSETDQALANLACPGRVTLSVSWEGAEALAGGVLSKPPLNCKSVSVTIEPGLMDARSPVHDAFGALRRLILLNEARATNIWPWHDVHREPLASSLEAYFASEASIAASSGIASVELGSFAEDDGSTALGSRTPQVRTDLDFTERLFIFLKDAVSTDDLRVCISAVFGVLQRGELQPVVHKTNSTALGLLLREAVRVSLMTTAPMSQESTLADTFGYWETEPLECLVEVGVYHLQRSYGVWLSARNLCTLTQLEWYVDPTLEANEHLHRLARLHLVLDTVYLANNHGVPYDALRSLCSRALVLYSEQTGMSASPLGGAQVDTPASADDAGDDDGQAGASSTEVSFVEIMASLARAPALAFDIALPIFTRHTTQLLDALRFRTPNTWGLSAATGDSADDVSVQVLQAGRGAWFDQRQLGPDEFALLGGASSLLRI